MPIHYTVTETTPLPVRSSGDTSAHGATFVETNVPFVAGSPIYGFIPSNFRVFTSGTGTTSVSNQMFNTASGTSLGDYGTIQSLRSINYKTGSSAVIRVAGYFSTPQASSWMGMGAFTLGDELSFGYNGLDFGVWHRHNGKAEVRTFEVTGAAGGSENATVTVNGVAHTVPLTNATVQTNAQEIAAYIDANDANFSAEQLDDTVIVSALSDGAKSNTWSFSSSTATATVAQVTEGVTKTSDHVTQENWNGEEVEGFDPAMGQNYEIRYSNGFGMIEFLVEDTVRQRYVSVHVIKWPNTSTAANLGNPSLRVGCYATALGTITSVDVHCAYLAGFVSHMGAKVRNPRGVSHTKSIGTTETNLLTIHNKRIYNGVINQAEIEPLNLSLSNDGTKSAVFRLVANPTVSGTPNFQDAGTNLITEIDTAGTTVTGGTELVLFTVAKASSIDIDLSAFHIRMPPTLRLVIAAEMTSGSAADLTASINVYEDTY